MHARTLQTERKIGGVTRTLIADECPLIREGFKSIFSSMKSIEVVGEAATASATLRLAAETRPGVVVLDPDFGAGSPVASWSGEPTGMEVCRRLRSAAGPLRIIAYTYSNTVTSLMALRLAKLDGYVHKSTRLERLSRDLENAVLLKKMSWNLCLEPE